MNFTSTCHITSRNTQISVGGEDGQLCAGSNPGVGAVLT